MKYGAQPSNLSTPPVNEEQWVCYWKQCPDFPLFFSGKLAFDIWKKHLHMLGPYAEFDMQIIHM